MIASRQEEISSQGGIGQQYERRIGAVAQFIGRTAIPVFHKHVVAAAKRVGADMLNFTVQNGRYYC